jgi:subfamily B ATP-binding cassette protein MsbA
MERGGFLYLFKPYKKKTIIAFIAILIVNILGLAFPWVVKIVIDEVLIKKNVSLLNLLVIGLILIFIMKFYFGYLREYSVSFIGENVVRDLREKIYWHLQKLSVKYVENTSTGKIISGIIGDVESIKKFLFGGIVDFVYSFLNIFFILVLLFILDWKLTVVSLLYLPLFAFTFLKLAPRLKYKYRKVRDKYAEMTARLNEVFSGIRIVAGFAKEEYEARTFSLKQKEILNASLDSHKLGILLWVSSELVSSVGLAVIFWLGVRAVFVGRITVGTLMAFYSYLGMLFFPIVKMVFINNYYQEAVASVERINEILAIEPEIKEKRFPITLNTLSGNIKFTGVSFSYNKREVLSEVDLDIRASEVVALVGKSGAGKSTLINLLLRFYEPTKGEIFIDGYRLKDIELKSYRSRIAIVPQDDYLFSATIRENILYSKPGASEAEVIRVAKLANAHQFIVELPNGYDTQIGERGAKLSYGQRQRISIARAILRDPSILILDEATSCVDSETERLIIEDAYRKVMRQRTTFIITPRLSLITYVDKIIFIEKGRITEVGNHCQLLERKGRYWEMWINQTVDYRPTSKDFDNILKKRVDEKIFDL